MIVKCALCVCECVCVDRAGGWAQGPADWGAAQTLSQMPPGRTDRFFVQGAQRADPGTHSLSTVTTIKHNTQTPCTHVHMYTRTCVHPCSLVCAHIFYSALLPINTHTHIRIHPYVHAVHHQENTHASKHTLTEA